MNREVNVVMVINTDRSITMGIRCYTEIEPAHAEFRALAKGLCPYMTDDEIESALDDGFVDIPDNRTLLLDTATLIE